MKNSPRDKMPERALLEAAFGLSVLVAACTPATPDFTPLAEAGGTTSGPTPGEDSGTTSGPAPGQDSGTTTGPTPGEDSGTTTGPTPGQDSGTTTGPTPGSDGGTTTGPTPGSDGGATPDAEAGAAPTGCNWIKNADGTSMFDPSSPNKIVLFDGTTLSNWHKENQPNVPIQWTLNTTDGTMTVVPSGTGVATEVQSSMKFENLCVHVEYLTPMYPSDVTGQYRGNSGVYLKSAYEMQILDSYGDPPDINTCGAVYSIAKPLVVACHMELVWNTYEIEFKSSVWNNATPPVKTQNAEYVKCALNGQIVQLNVELNPAAGYTPAGIPDAPGPQPLGLQDHLDYVSFRNIWVRVPQY
jgi:hypothetical protein